MSAEIRSNAPSPVVALIVAAARNGVIGRDGAMPWRLASDLKRFRALTMGKPIVMGRKTFDSIGKPLDGRHSVVISRTLGFAPPGVTVAHDIPAALVAAKAFAQLHQACEIMIIGGAQIYQQTLSRAGRIYLTRVDAVVDGDAIFPTPDPAFWRLVSRDYVPAGPKDQFAHTFEVLERDPGLA